MKYLLLFFVLFTLNACSPVCVCQFKSTSTIVKDNTTYENDTIIVKYNFWQKSGVFTFSVTNKMSIPIYIDLKKCNSYINGNGYIYWQDQQLINSQTSSGNKRLTYNVSVGGSAMTGVVNRSERIIFITPHSTYNSTPITLSDFNNFKGRLHDSIVMAGNQKIKVVNCSEQKSPLKVRNFITYSIHENFDIEKYSDNSFWLSNILLVKNKYFDSYGPVYRKPNAYFFYQNQYNYFTIIY